MGASPTEAGTKDGSGTRLPALRGAITTQAGSEAPSSPAGGVHIINMDAAKRGKKLRSPRKGGKSVNADGKQELTADEALKLYYDKMAALEMKLKNDMELMRRRRQGLLVAKKTEEEESDSQELNQIDLAPSKQTLDGRDYIE